MALTEDQRALLRLLLAGDDYAQVASVLGASAAEIRERAHAAAAALERDPDPELSAGAVRHRLRQLDGDASPPQTSTLQGPPTRSRRLVWAIGAGAVAILALVLALTVLGGDDDGSDGSEPPVDREEAVRIDLAPVGGSQARGAVTIIRLVDQPALDLAIRGLEPSGPDQTYVLWFVGSGARSLPVAFQAVGRDGEISGRAPIPGAATGLLPNFDTAELTLTQKRDAAAAIRQGGHTGMLPERVGTVVLRGALPR